MQRAQIHPLLPDEIHKFIFPADFGELVLQHLGFALSADGNMADALDEVARLVVAQAAAQRVEVRQLDRIALMQAAAARARQKILRLLVAHVQRKHDAHQLTAVFRRGFAREPDGHFAAD